MTKFELPQMILTGLILVGLGIALSRYGQQKTEKYNVIDLLAPVITLTLLWWGGFYGG